MTGDEHRINDEKVFTFLAEDRPVQVTDGEHVAYVTGLSVGQVKGALRRLEANGRVRVGSDG